MLSEESEFDRGHVAGGIEARLAGHDKHFAAINGSLGDIARELGGLKLAVQRLSDQSVADAKTRVTTATALKEAVDARRAQSETSWSPWQKLLALLGGVAAVVGIYLALKS